MVSGGVAVDAATAGHGVSISFSSGFWFQGLGKLFASPASKVVSISFSSGFWFQEVRLLTLINDVSIRFNLVLEWLLVSGAEFYMPLYLACLFQSRSRVAFGFRPKSEAIANVEQVRFNLVLEWLLVSGILINRNTSVGRFLTFQSRSRVAFGFRCKVIGAAPVRVGEFQSRSRVAFGFRHSRFLCVWDLIRCFNLVLEWLLVSGVSTAPAAILSPVTFQSRSRVAFGFRFAVPA